MLGKLKTTARDEKSRPSPIAVALGRVTASDGWVLGIGRVATRLSGPLLGAPSVTPFSSLTPVAAYSQRTDPKVRTFGSKRPVNPSFAD